MKDIFGLYYEFPKRRFKLEPYLLPGNQFLTVRQAVVEGSWYYIILRYAANRGFRMLLDAEGKRYDKSLWQRWPALVKELTLFVGSDANGNNQINGLLRFYIYPEWLPDSEVETLWREKTLSLSMRHLDLKSSPFGNMRI